MLTLFCALLACPFAGDLQGQITVVPELDTIGNPSEVFKPTMSWHGQAKSEYWLSQNLDLGELDLAKSTKSELPPRRDANVRPTKRLQPIKRSLLEPIFSIEPYAENSAQVRLASFEQLTRQDDDEKTGDAKSKEDESEQEKEGDKQEPAPTTPVIANEQSLKALEQQIKDRIELVTNLPTDDPEKEEKLQQLNSANVWIQKANSSQTLIDSQLALQAKFDEDLKKLKAKLAVTPVPQTPEPSMNSETLQMKLQELRAELQKLKTQQDDNQGKMDARDERITKLPADRIAVTDRLNKLKTSISNLEKQPDGPSRELSSMFLKAQEWAAKKELEALDQETPRLDQIGKLLPVERDGINQNIQKLEAEIKAFSTAYDDRRQQDIKDQEAEAKRLFEAAINADPALKIWAETNQELAEQRREWTAGINLAESNEKIVKAQWEDIKSTLDGIIKETETNITTETGITLIEKRNSLLRPGESQARILAIKTKLQDIRMLALKWKEDRKKLASPDQVVAELVAERQHFHDIDEVSKKDLEAIEAKKSKGLVLTQPELAILEKANQNKGEFIEMARTLVMARIKYLDALDSDYEVYRKALLSEEKERRNLVNQIADMRNFIDEKALWIQSAHPLNPTHFADSMRAAGALLKGEGWSEVGIGIRERILGRPYHTGFALVVLFGLLFTSRRLKVSHD